MPAAIAATNKSANGGSAMALKTFEPTSALTGSWIRLRMRLFARQLLVKSTIVRTMRLPNRHRQYPVSLKTCTPKYRPTCNASARNCYEPHEHGASAESRVEVRDAP